MSYSGYPKYSGVDCSWLGKLPHDWQALKLKRVIDPDRPITYGIVQAGEHVENGIPYIRPIDMSDEGGIKDASGLLKTSQEIAASYHRSSLEERDLVCSIGPSFGKVMVVPKVLSGGNLTQGTARIAISSRNDYRYFFWALRSNRIYEQWQSSVGGATFRALNLGPLSETVVPVPSPSEQTQIARFLDHQTARIDALIAEQQRLIELLKEKRQAVISHAVTKGLDPDVAMKDSGVEWLGEVPEHWEVRKLSTVTDKITNGYVGPTRDLFVEEGIPYLQSLHIKNNQIIFSPEYYVPKWWSDEHAKSILKPDDVLIVQTGDIGQIAVVPDDFPEANCHALIVTSTIKQSLSGSWLAWVLLSDYGYNSLMSIKTGALHPHLNCGYVKDIYIPVPPLLEQAETMDFLTHEEQGHQKLLSQAESAIGLLQERRSALISAAVTGKIDVRDWQPPSSETFPDSSVKQGVPV